MMEDSHVMVDSPELEDNSGLEDSSGLGDSPGLEDSSGLKDSPVLEGQGRVVGGLSTGVVEVAAGRLRVEASPRSAGRDRRPGSGPTSWWWWWSPCRERPHSWSFSEHRDSRANSNSR